MFNRSTFKIRARIIRKYIPHLIIMFYEKQMQNDFLLNGVNKNALAYEFELRKISYDRQKEIELKYKDRIIGKHRIDFFIEDKVILELKAADAIHPIYKAQLLTYLRATGKQVGLLINFNVERLKDGIKRFII